MNFVIPVVTTVLILAKIFGVAPVASWSWLWVLSPFWVPLLFALVMIIFVLVTEK